MSPYIIPGIQQQQTVDQIIADSFNVSPADLPKKTRVQEIVDARHFAMYYRRKFLHMTINQVGAMYNRDHATTIWAAGTSKRPGKVENMIQVDKLYRARAAQCLERLKKFHEK